MRKIRSARMSASPYTVENAASDDDEDVSATSQLEQHLQQVQQQILQNLHEQNQMEGALQRIEQADKENREKQEQEKQRGQQEQDTQHGQNLQGKIVKLLEEKVKQQDDEINRLKHKLQNKKILENKVEQLQNELEQQTKQQIFVPRHFEVRYMSSVTPDVSVNTFDTLQLAQKFFTEKNNEVALLLQVNSRTSVMVLEQKGKMSLLKKMLDL